MRSIEATDLAARFDELLDEANEGMEITVTQNGVPYAVLGPVKQIHSRREQDVKAAHAAADRISRTAEGIRRRNKITREEIKSWIEEGRP